MSGAVVVIEICGEYGCGMPPEGKALVVIVTILVLVGFWVIVLTMDRLIGGKA